MIIPVRCFSCGSVVGGKWKEFGESLKKGESPEKAADDAGIKRYCCRRMVFSHVDLTQEIAKFKV